MVKRRLGPGKLAAPCSGRNFEGSRHNIWFGLWCLLLCNESNETFYGNNKSFKVMIFQIFKFLITFLSALSLFEVAIPLQAKTSLKPTCVLYQLLILHKSFKNKSEIQCLSQRFLCSFWQISSGLFDRFLLVTFTGTLITLCNKLCTQNLPEKGDRSIGLYLLHTFHIIFSE